METERFHNMPITRAVYGPKGQDKERRPPLHQGSTLAAILGKDVVQKVRQTVKGHHA